MARRGSFQAKATGSSKRLAIGLFDSAASLWVLCAKHATGVCKKLRSQSTSARVAPRSPMARPRQFLTSISNKTFLFRHKKREAAAASGEEFLIDGDSEFGDGGLWQRSILMGDKCQPLDFSGVIYYDSNGRQVDELPVRSPRASPLPGYFYNSAAKREKEF